MKASKTTSEVMLKFTPARSNEIQVDLDTVQSRKIFKRQLRFLRATQHLKIISVRKFISRSGNQHVSIFVSRPLPIMERIALAALLGSDLRREMCNWGRTKNGAPHPILFIHKRSRLSTAPHPV